MPTGLWCSVRLAPWWQINGWRLVVDTSALIGVLWLAIQIRAVDEWWWWFDMW
jgi:hypothetical protein